MAKYSILGVKLAIEYFPYQELYELLKVWGRKWLIDGEKRTPEIKNIKEALKQAICCALFSNGYRRQLEKSGNNGWKFFNITIYPRYLDYKCERKTAIYISYKVSRGRSWTGCSKHPKPHVKHPGIIYFRVLKNGKIERR